MKILKQLDALHGALFDHRYIFLITALLCVFVINIFYPENIYGGRAQLIYLPFQIAACCLVFKSKRHLLYLLGIVIVLLGISHFANIFFSQDRANEMALFYICFFGGVFIEVMRQIYYGELHSAQFIIAGVCGLLLIGYFSFYIFLAIELHQPGSFNNLADGYQAVNDLFYFSYITILTIGYGYITPKTWIARNATVLVAFLAYIYSWVVIATIVSEATTAMAARTAKKHKEEKKDSASK